MLFCFKTAARSCGWTAFMVVAAIGAVVPAFGATTLPGFQEEVIATLSRPTGMAFAPDGRLFVMEQAGRIRIIKNKKLLPTPFATLSVNTSSSRGLLGLAFDPNFSSNGHIFI